MNIVYIITSLGYGGAERLLVNSCNELVKKEGIEISIIYLKHIDDLKPLFDPQIKLYKTGLSNPIITFFRIRKLLKQINPEIIHTHLGHADLLGLIASVGMNSVRFLTLHNVWYKFNSTDKLIFFLYRVVTRFIAPTVHVIGISKAVKRHAIMNLGIDKERVSFIPNSIPVKDYNYDRVEAREILGLNNKIFLIVFIGRLRVQKSVDTLIRASKLLNVSAENVKILIIGEGELKSSLVKLAEGVPIVYFVGTTDSSDLYLAAADVLVLPSVFEGLPTVILESFRNATPVIVSDIDGSRDLVEEGRNGYLFPANDPKALANKIEIAMGNGDLQELGKIGKKDFLLNYTLDRYIGSHFKLYKKLL